MLDAVRVVAITDRRMMGATHDAFGAAIARALRGCPPGAVLVQVREKDLDGAELLALVTLAQRYAPVAVNDRVDIALAANTPAVHLPEAALSVADARAIFPRTVGVSRHAPDATSGADYLHLGPIFATPSKPGVPPLGLDVLGAPHGRAKLVAIGGIDSPDKAQRAAQAGADAVAVIRAAWTGDSLASFVAAVDAGIALRATAPRPREASLVARGSRSKR